MDILYYRHLYYLFRIQYSSFENQNHLQRAINYCFVIKQSSKSEETIGFIFTKRDVFYTFQTLELLVLLFFRVFFIWNRFRTNIKTWTVSYEDSWIVDVQLFGGPISYFKGTNIFFFNRRQVVFMKLKKTWNDSTIEKKKTDEI